MQSGKSFADGQGTGDGKATEMPGMTESGEKEKWGCHGGENETKPEERFFGIQLIGAGQQDCRRHAQLRPRNEELLYYPLYY